MHNYVAHYSNGTSFDKAFLTYYCHDNVYGNVTEGLRRWIANPFLFERESSNLSVVGNVCSFDKIGV